MKSSQSLGPLWTYPTLIGSKRQEHRKYNQTKTCFAWLIIFLLYSLSCSAVAQFAQIEAHLVALLTSVAAAESVSPERVAALRHSVREARRNEFRRQQREAERRRQEERNQRILQRAQAPPPPPRMVGLLWKQIVDAWMLATHSQLWDQLLAPFPTY